MRFHLDSYRLHVLYNLGNIFLTTYFKHCFYGVMLFFLDPNLHNLFESLSLKYFLVDFSVDFLIDSLMCLNISFLALKILKSFSSGLFLMNSQLSSFSNAFCLFISWLIFLSLWRISSTSITSL